MAITAMILAVQATLAAATEVMADVAVGPVMAVVQAIAGKLLLT